MSKKTRLLPAEIIEQASKYFGTDIGLSEKKRNSCCIFFEGSGGYVSVNLVEEDRRRVVETEGREWEYQVKEFMGRL
ncbi:MAG: hypothetical protein ACE5DO_01525 [Desulfobacterales bacterium]